MDGDCTSTVRGAGGRDIAEEEEGGQATVQVCLELPIPDPTLPWRQMLSSARKAARHAARRATKQRSRAGKS